MKVEFNADAENGLRVLSLVFHRYIMKHPDMDSIDVDDAEWVLNDLEVAFEKEEERKTMKTLKEISSYFVSRSVAEGKEVYVTLFDAEKNTAVCKNLNDLSAVDYLRMSEAPKGFIFCVAEEEKNDGTDATL